MFFPRAALDEGPRGLSDRDENDPQEIPWCTPRVPHRYRQSAHGEALPFAGADGSDDSGGRPSSGSGAVAMSRAQRTRTKGKGIAIKVGVCKGREKKGITDEHDGNDGGVWVCGCGCVCVRMCGGG